VILCYVEFTARPDETLVTTRSIRSSHGWKTGTKAGVPSTGWPERCGPVCS